MNAKEEALEILGVFDIIYDKSYSSKDYEVNLKSANLSKADAKRLMERLIALLKELKIEVYDYNELKKYAKKFTYENREWTETLEYYIIHS